MTGAQDEKRIVWTGLPGAGGVYYITDENRTQQAICVHGSETPEGRTFARRVLLAPLLAEALTDLFAVIPHSLMGSAEVVAAVIQAEELLGQFYHGGEGA